MKLYILISDGGDGSYYPRFILDPAILQTYTDADKEGLMSGEDLGCDGDGFHYSTINVPDDSTPESLSISKYVMAEPYSSEEY